MNTQAADRHVDLTRLLAAPRDVVFRAWVEPEQVAEWWGPDGFETPREKIVIEPRVGGRFDLVMVVRSPEIAAGMGIEVGTEFPDRAEIVEFVESERIVLRHPPQPEIGLPVETATRIEFHDAGDDRTRVVIASGPYSEQMAPNAEAGWIQQLGKLERLLGDAA